MTRATNDVFPDSRLATRIKLAYCEAVQLQNASNPNGILRTFAEQMELVREDLRTSPPPCGTIQYGTDAVKHHPIFVLMASKVHDMAGLGVSDLDRYGLACNFAEEVSHDNFMIGSVAYREALASYFAEFNHAS